MVRKLYEARKRDDIDFARNAKINLGEWIWRDSSDW